MIVELKKTKITKSIVEQSLSADYGILYKDYTVLGWCVLKLGKKSYRKSLVYNNSLNTILAFNYIEKASDIEIKNHIRQKSDNNGGWLYLDENKINIYYRDLNNIISYGQTESMSIEDMEKFFEKLRDFCQLINEKGQIYL